MPKVQVRPTGEERCFGRDEVIVSKTDTRGCITYANEVFLRVSGYREDEVVGQPHNLIRHPDMPACVFQLLWDTINSGHELFAYVLNLAADGAHYWVFAHVTPSFGPDGRIVGYHSNRRAPGRAAVERTDALYRSLRAEERRHPRGSAAIAASSALLSGELARHGMTFDEFVWSLTDEEIA